MANDPPMDDPMTEADPPQEFLSLEESIVALKAALAEKDLAQAALAEQTAKLEQFDSHKMFLDTVNQCKFPVFDGTKLDTYSLTDFFGNLDAFIEKSLPDWLKVKVLTVRLGGVPREVVTQQLKSDTTYCTFEGAKSALEAMFRVHDPAAKSEQIIKQGKGYLQGSKTVPEYVQGIMPHLNRIQSTDHDKQRYLLLGLKDKGFRAAVAVCDSTPDHRFPSVGELSQRILMVDAVQEPLTRELPAGSGSSKDGNGGNGGAHGQDKDKGKGKGKGGLSVQGGIQKPKPDFAKSIPCKDRVQMRKDGLCFACGQKGHTQRSPECPKFQSGSKN